MTSPDNSGDVRSQRSKRLLVLLPLFFLVLVYVALFSGLFGLGRGEDRPVLTRQESQQLSDTSKSLLAQEHYQDALRPTLTLYQAYPENHIYIARLAEIYDHLGQYDEEARYWEKYMDHAPTPIEACPQIGQAYWKQGEKFEPQAIAAYQHCAALDPKDADSMFYLAHALEMSGKWAEAAEGYQRGLTISPDYTDLSLGLARCWLRLNKVDQGNKLVDKILAKHPDSSGAWLVLGMIYIQRGNYPGAKKVLTQGLHLAATDPDFHILLARVANHMNDDAEARRQYAWIAEHASKRDELAAPKENK